MMRPPSLQQPQAMGALPFMQSMTQQSGAAVQPGMLAQTPPPVGLAQSPAALAFQKLLEQSVDLGREDLEQGMAVEEPNLRQLVARALRDPSADDLEPGESKTLTTGPRVNGFFSPLAAAGD